MMARRTVREGTQRRKVLRAHVELGVCPQKVRVSMLASHGYRASGGGARVGRAKVGRAEVGRASVGQTARCSIRTANFKHDDEVRRLDRKLYSVLQNDRE
jgi:hypothetical protein